MIIRNYLSLWKSLLRLLICVQLCLGSYPGYAAEQGGNNHFQWPSNLIRLSEFLLEIGSRIESGTLDPYLEQHSEIKEHADHYSIAPQWVEVIQYDVVMENEVAVKKPRVYRTFFLNDYTEHPPDIQVTDIRVQYDPSKRAIVFEGIVNNRVVLKQYAPTFDVVTYITDPELLVVMDENKGLFLVDMSLVKESLAHISIPIIPIATRALKDPSAVMSSLSMEFVIPQRTEIPAISEEFKPILDLNGRSLIKAGDLIVSYEDAQGEKTLHQYIDRSELYGWIRETYNILYIMISFVAPELMNSKKRYDKFVNEITVQQEENKDTPILEYVVSALFTKHAIRRFIRAMDGISTRLKNLDLTDRHTLALEDWNQGVLAFREQENAFSKEAVVEAESRTQSSQPTSELKQYKEKIQDVKVKAFRKLAFLTNKSKNIITHDTTKVMGWSALILYGGTLLLPEQYTLIMNYMLHLFQYQDKGTTYAFTTMVNLLSLGLFVPAVAVLLSSGLPYYYKVKAQVIKFFGDLLSKDFPSEGVANEKFEEWFNVSKVGEAEQSTLKRFVNLNNFVGVSLKTVAITIVPFWERITNVIGQPHFFSALQRGLNPLKKINPDSNIGQLMKSKGMELTKPTLLGTQGWIPGWKWLSGDRYYQHRELQNAYETQDNTIKSIAWVMATLATAGHAEINPEELLLYGAAINKEDRLKVLSDKDLKLELDWVMLNLINHLKTIESIDWNTELSNPQMIEQLISSYKKAQLLAERFKSKSKLGRFVSKFVHSDQMKKFRNVVNAQTVTSWNKQQRKYLDGVPLEFVVGRAAPEAFWDNLATTSISVTYGGEVSRAELENVTALGQDSSNLFFASSDPHFNDMMQNWNIHLFIAAGRTALTFMETSSRIEDAHKEAQEIYKTPIPEAEDYVQGFFSYLYHGLFYPFVSGGEQDNLGDVLYRQEKSRMRLIQLNLLSFIGLRSFLVEDQPLSEVTMAAVMFYFAALWVYGWPWMVLQSGGKLNHNYLKKNEEKIKNVLIQFVNVSNGVSSNEQAVREEYRQALSNLSDLYVIKSRSRLMQMVVKVVEKSQSRRLQSMLESIGFSDGEIEMFKQQRFDDLAQRHSIESIQNISKLFSQQIAKHPPLPTQENGVGKNASIFYFGAVLSTVLALSLLVKTYQSEWLNADNLLFWIGTHVLGITVVYQMFKRGLIHDKEVNGEYRRSFKNIAVDKIQKITDSTTEKIEQVKSAIKGSCQKVFSRLKSKE